MDLLEERALLLLCCRICREIHNICVSGDRLSRVPLEAHLFCLLTVVILLFGNRWSDSYLRAFLGNCASSPLFQGRVYVKSLSPILVLKIRKKVGEEVALGVLSINRVCGKSCFIYINSGSVISQALRSNANNVGSN